MVKFVNDENEMTTWEACGKYKGLYIGFVGSLPPDPKEKSDEVLGKVLYTAETYEEQDLIPWETEDGKDIEIIYGFGIKDLPMGGVVLVPKN